MSPSCAANIASSPPRMRARRRTKCGCRWPPRAPMRSSSTGRAPIVPPKPTFLGSKVLRRLSDRRAGRLHRLDAVLPDLGTGRQISRHSRRREIRARPRARSTTTRAPCWTRSWPSAGSRPARSPASGRRMRRATISWCSATRRATSRSRRCIRCASSCPSARAAPMWRSPISSRRATAGLPITSAPSPSPPASARTRSPSASSAPTTTIPPSWSTRWPTAWRKPSPNACTSACARNSGAMRRTRRLRSDDLIAEKYRGIRPAPGYPAQPDHTEKGTLFQLLQAERIGVKLTESFAMWPGAAVCGLYFSHPQSALFRRRQDRARPGRGLRQAQGLEHRRNANAGWRRSSITRPSPRRASWRLTRRLCHQKSNTGEAALSGVVTGKPD